jgi:hypothetical protein
MDRTDGTPRCRGAGHQATRPMPPGTLLGSGWRSAAGAGEPPTDLLAALAWVSQGGIRTHSAVGLHRDGSNGFGGSQLLRSPHATQDRCGERSAVMRLRRQQWRTSTRWWAWVATEGRRLPQSHGDVGGDGAGAAIAIPVLVTLSVLVWSVEQGPITDGQARSWYPRRQPRGYATSTRMSGSGRSRRAVCGPPGGPDVGVSAATGRCPMPLADRDSSNRVRQIASAPISQAADRCGERSAFAGSGHAMGAG